MIGGLTKCYIDFMSENTYIERDHADMKMTYATYSFVNSAIEWILFLV